MTDLGQRVEEALREFVDAAGQDLAAIAPELDELTGTARRFLLAGGKRLRPTFCYWGFRAAGAPDGPELIRAAAALELLHAAALMHDDVIDASDDRRGEPAVHRRFAALHAASGWHGESERFGAAAAVLLGDLVLIWADAMLGTSGFDAAALRRASPVWDRMRIEVMCGQYLDVVEQARGGGSVARALRVARHKSASYTIEAPLRLGACLAGGSAELLAALTAYGVPLGEAFQLRDDLLGVFGDPARTGKPAGDDIREGKRTVLVALAVEAATAEQRAALHRRLGDPALDDSGAADVRAILTATGAVDQVEALIDDRVAAARRALASAPLTAAARDALLDLTLVATRRDE